MLVTSGFLIGEYTKNEPLLLELAMATIDEAYIERVRLAHGIIAAMAWVVCEFGNILAY